MRTLDLFEAVLREEFEDFKENFSSKTTNEKIDLVNKKGDVLLPSMLDVEIFEKINGVISNEFDCFNSSNYLEASKLFRAISDDVKIIRNAPMQKGLKFIFKTLIESAEDPKFAGLIIVNRDEDFIFNPLHPVNLHLLKNGEIELPKTFDIFIFSFYNDEIEDKDDNIVEKAYKMHLLYYSLFTQSVIKDLEYRINIVEEHEDFKDLILLSDIEAYIEILKNIGKNFNSILFPLQILSKGEMVPYMGWGAITKDIKAINLFGNLTGNLKAYHYSSNLQVCTGHKSSMSIDGWYTLSKINYNSTWFSDYVNKNFVEISIAGFMLSKDILLGTVSEKLESIKLS